MVSGGGPEVLEALEIAPVGHYALRIRWSDDHKSGIYPFSLLRSLCGCGRCQPPVDRA